MICSYCGLTFDPEGARTQCAGCFKIAACKGVRCPRCGYDMPEELGLVKWIRAWKEKRNARKTGNPT